MVLIPERGVDYIDYELVGGGPADGKKGQMYRPVSEIRIRVPQADVFIACAGAPTFTELFHVYRLSYGTKHKLFFEYRGYTT